MEKGEIAHFEQFHLFPQCFPRGFIVNVLKWVYMEERVKDISCLFFKLWIKEKMTLTNIFSFTQYFQPFYKNISVFESHVCRLVVLGIWTCLKFCLLVKYRDMHVKKWTTSSAYKVYSAPGDIIFNDRKKKVTTWFLYWIFVCFFYLHNKTSHIFLVVQIR